MNHPISDEEHQMILNFCCHPEMGPNSMPPPNQDCGCRSRGHSYCGPGPHIDHKQHRAMYSILDMMKDNAQDDQKANIRGQYHNRHFLANPQSFAVDYQGNSHGSHPYTQSSSHSSDLLRHPHHPRMRVAKPQAHSQDEVMSYISKYPLADKSFKLQKPQKANWESTSK